VGDNGKYTNAQTHKRTNAHHKNTKLFFRTNTQINNNHHQVVMSENTANKKGKGGGSGKRYQFKILFNSIKRIKPVCTAEWDDVAENYHRESKEQKLRDGAELKRTFFNHKKMCNKHKVPTGTSDDAPFVKECIKLANELGDKEHKGIAGGSDSEEEDEMEEKEEEDEEEEDDDEVDVVGAAGGATEPVETPVDGAGGGTKRKANATPTSTPKTKNSKPSGSTGSSESSRQGTSSIIRSIGESVSSLANQSTIELMMAQQQAQSQQQTQMFMQMMQQQQQQAAQQATQQQQMMQMMMFAMMGRRSMPSNSSMHTATSPQSLPSFNLQDENEPSDG